MDEEVGHVREMDVQNGFLFVLLLINPFFKVFFCAGHYRVGEILRAWGMSRIGVHDVTFLKNK